MGQATASLHPFPSHCMHHHSGQNVVFRAICWTSSVACLLYQRSVGSTLIVIFRVYKRFVGSHASCHGCRVRALGSTVEEVLSSSKHPDLLQQLLSDVDSLQKAR